MLGHLYPYKEIATQKTKLQGNIESIFQVNWNQLNRKQQQAILEKLGKQKGVPKQTALNEILTNGLPIRRSLIQSVGTSQIEILSQGI